MTIRIGKGEAMTIRISAEAQMMKFEALSKEFVRLTQSLDNNRVWFDELERSFDNFHNRVADTSPHLAAELYEAAPRRQAPAITSELVEAAIERINTSGWVQEEYGSPSDGYCAIGALGDEVSSLHATCGLGNAWERELMNLMGIDQTRWVDIPTWNDASVRTKEQVLDALMNAAKKLREMGR